MGEPARAVHRAGRARGLADPLRLRHDDERAVFELLQTASGVGPRLAQAMLAVHAPDTLRTIFATEDVAALTLVPGIGQKGAQRLLLELKDRLGAPTGAVPAQAQAAGAARPGRRGASSCSRR